VLYERAMGLPRPLIVWKYILRSALTSTVTQIGLLFGILLAGAVVTEAVFDWPGIGTYAVNSILRSDYNAVMGFTIWAGAVFIMVNLLVDVAPNLVAPRARTTESHQRGPRRPPPSLPQSSIAPAEPALERRPIERG